MLQIGALDSTEEFSQELRFTSSDDRAWRYSVGAYYYSVETKDRNSGVSARTPLPPFIFANLCPCIQFFPGVGFALGRCFPALPFRWATWFSAAGLTNPMGDVHRRA